MATGDGAGAMIPPSAPTDEAEPRVSKGDGAARNSRIRQVQRVHRLMAKNAFSIAAASLSRNPP
jgi:hypothetical protein